MSRVSFPKSLVASLERELKERVETHWTDRVVAVAVRQEKPFVYVSVRLQGREVCEPLFRLRFLGGANPWEFALYSWSHGVTGGYKSSFLADGRIGGTAVECLDCALPIDFQICTVHAVRDSKGSARARL